jgi:hypothetical protein
MCCGDRAAASRRGRPGPGAYFEVLAWSLGPDSEAGAAPGSLWACNPERRDHEWWALDCLRCQWR